MSSRLINSSSNASDLLTIGKGSEDLTALQEFYLKTFLSS